MPTDQFLDLIPLWAFFALTALLILGAIEFGLFLGLRRRAQREHEKEGPVGTVVGATLGLLAFMLAFTFGITASRFDTRKELLLDEVNALGTAWLRAGLLVEPHRAASENHLREYIDIRASFSPLSVDSERFVAALRRCEEIQGSLWEVARALAAANRSSEIDALFIASLNDVIDLHTKRVIVGMQYRIPSVLWVVLMFVSVLAMATVGYQFGLAGKRSLAANLALALTFSAVTLLICDLDRPGRGMMRVNQQPMIDLQRQINSQAP